MGGWIRVDFDQEMNIQCLDIADYAAKHKMAQTEMEVIRKENEDLRGEVLLLHWASAKELENFLWDVENYFKATKVSDGEKVSVTTMYLGNDAKVWWRTRVDEVESGKLKTQFLPSNLSWLARDRLRRLKQSNTVKAYVKEFSSLMINIGNMVEEDKLHYFISRRQNVQTLNSAIVAADKLADFDEGDDPRDASHFK
ncbi:hypothetical protein R3W88_016472 [Solanum pinnatisectum]|uniref:Retrotransposon gag domain-containing protein n=1 Tax=Solanum pinnatisectum TaxID=50273 RepID=A0AAV9KXP2_9SOLN|nr:hypothetical protein R3W88_016472 [Solanum pinnatisectum]